MSTSERHPPKDAAVPALINAVINGAIAYNDFAGRTDVPLTVDAISSTEATVGASGTMLALSLAVILTWITIALEQRKRRGSDRHAAGPSMLRAALRLSIENALMLFGAAVVIGVLWQRLFGSVLVSPVVAAALVGVIAAVATVVVHVRTTSALAATSDGGSKAR
jgi:di/tricarboxylate transporter